MSKRELAGLSDDWRHKRARHSSKPLHEMAQAYEGVRQHCSGADEQEAKHVFTHAYRGAQYWHRKLSDELARRRAGGGVCLGDEDASE